jgi:hypothetical protein
MQLKPFASKKQFATCFTETVALIGFASHRCDFALLCMCQGQGGNGVGGEGNVQAA